MLRLVEFFEIGDYSDSALVFRNLQGVEEFSLVEFLPELRGLSYSADFLVQLKALLVLGRLGGFAEGEFLLDFICEAREEYLQLHALDAICELKISEVERFGLLEKVRALEDLPPTFLRALLWSYGEISAEISFDVVSEMVISRRFMIVKDEMKFAIWQGLAGQLAIDYLEEYLQTHPDLRRFTEHRLLDIEAKIYGFYPAGDYLHAIAIEHGVSAKMIKNIYFKPRRKG